jgi:coenzyme F420-reducing hydrogenase delta subunit/ferredoxin
VAADNPLAGSAAAAHAMFELFAERQARPLAPAAAMQMREEPRLGVFVCECGGEVSDVVDTRMICHQALGWPGVVHAQVLRFSCSPEAAETMAAAVHEHALSGAVLAACSCCAIDQVCYSCTYQRIRCKSNLGIFPERPSAIPSTSVEFVNIREQCAWAHAEDPQAATAKAIALTAASMAKLQSAGHRAIEAQHIEHAVLVLGSGAAARTSVEALARQGIAVRQIRSAPTQVLRANRRYRVIQAGASWEAPSLILAPTEAESSAMLAAFGENGDRPRVLPAWGGTKTQRPGVYFCDPARDPSTEGAAVAARCAAWLGHMDGRADPIAAVVDPARCRACGTCVEICEFGAPQLCGEDPQRTSWIDPVICTGCATCASHCPSGAITAGYATDMQLERMLEAALIDREDPSRLPKIAVITCNWAAYSGLETAGRERMAYPASTRSIKVLCLGQLSPGIVLKAFEKGADGLLLLGCPPGKCHYEFGNRREEALFAQASQMALRLGIGEERLRLDWVDAGEGESFVEKVQAFCAGLGGKRA